MTIHFLNINNYIKNDYIAQIGIKSWQKYMPEHQIKIWTENDEFIKNILNDKNNNIIKYYLNKNNVYVFEYLRLKIIYEFGGIFSEPDMILLEHLDIKDNDEFFFNISNFNGNDNLGITCYPIILKKNNILIKMFLDYLENDFEFDNSSLYNYSEFDFCSLRFIKDNQDFEKNYELLCSETKFFKEKSLIDHKVLHFYDYFLLDIFETFLISTEDIHLFFCKYREFYGDKIAYYRILIENPKLSKYQIAYLKYMIFNHQELKEKIFDFENILGDLNKISPKDFEILNNI